MSAGVSEVGTELICSAIRYVDYPDPIRIDSESSQNYGCNC